MRHILSIHTSLLAAAVALTAGACTKPQPALLPPAVTVAPAVERQVADWDEFSGHFEAVHAVEVRPRVSGFIQRVTFPEGATVREGDPLFIIDPRPYEADVARAEAMLEQARTRERLAQMELDRAKQLVNTQAISREELDARTSGVAEGSSAIRAAEAALKIARLNLEWTTVRAPITGRVSRAEITAGNLVQAGAPAASLLTTIVSLDPIYVYFDSDEQSYLKFAGARTGATGKRIVQIGLGNEAGFPHEGALDFIDNRIDRSGTIRARAVVKNPNHLFAPGLFARVRIVGGEARRATLVQDGAIGTDQDRKFVLILKPDSTVEYRAVTLGRMFDGLRVVQSGLAPGENVVVNGLLRVRPGMRVAAKSSPMVVSAAPKAQGAQ